MSKGWWNERTNHALARRGIKTAKTIPKKQPMGNGNKEATKGKLSDSIQNDMHGLDKKLRLAATSQNPETVRQHLIDARSYYDRLTQKIVKYKQSHGELPWWVSQTWHGQETFSAQSKGKVWKIMESLTRSATEKEIRQNQKRLYEAIKTPNESGWALKQ